MPVFQRMTSAFNMSPDQQCLVGIKHFGPRVVSQQKQTLNWPFDLFQYTQTIMSFFECAGKPGMVDIIMTEFYLSAYEAHRTF